MIEVQNCSCHAEQISKDFLISPLANTVVKHNNFPRLYSLQTPSQGPQTKWQDLNCKLLPPRIPNCKLLSPEDPTNPDPNPKPQKVPESVCLGV